MVNYCFDFFLITVLTPYIVSGGVHGVFDVEEIVSILKSKNAEDIVVIQTDPSVGFAHQIVIVSGKSSRHLQALAGFIRRVYKKKMQKGDLVPHVEGKKKSEDWLALDLGKSWRFCRIINLN